MLCSLKIMESDGIVLRGEIPAQDRLMSHGLNETSAILDMVLC
jgi:hypothetical protein